MWVWLALLCAWAQPTTADHLKEVRAEAMSAWSDGDLDTAIRLGETLLSEWEVIDDPERIGDASNLLGAFYERAGDLEAALPLFERSLEVFTALEGPDHEQALNAAINLGGLVLSMGDHRRAETLLGEAIASLKSREGANPAQLAAALNAYGVLHRDRGDYAAAIDAYEQSIEVHRTRPDGDVAAAGALYNLAMLVVEQGDLDAADELLREALLLRERKYGVDHPKVAATLTGLGMVAEARADLVRARALYERSLEIESAVYGDSHPDLAFALNNLAGVLALSGDREGSRVAYERAREILEGSVGMDNGLGALILQNLSELYRRVDDNVSATALLEQSLEIRISALGEDHPQVAEALAGLGRIAMDGDDFDTALRLAERAMAIRTAVLEADHPAISESHLHLGILAALHGDLDAADAHLVRAREIAERAFGPNHPRLARVVQAQGGVATRRHDRESERRYLNELLDIADRFAREILDAVSEREALEFMAAHLDYLDNWLTAIDDPEDTEATWNRLLAWRGAVARRMAARQLAARLERDAPEVAELETVRWDLARTAMSESWSGDGAARQAELSALTARKEQLERTLAATADISVAVAPSARELCAALPPETARIDYHRYRNEEAMHDIALVMRSGSCDEMIRVDLGESKDIDAAVSEWRQVLAYHDRLGQSATRRIDQRGEAVTAAIWDPIAPHVAGVTTAIVSPDAATANVPFAALPLGSGRYLIEDLNVVYTEPGRAASEVVNVGSVLVGAVDFGPTTDAECGVGSWTALPGTGREIAAIENRLRKGRRAEPVTALTGVAATEIAVKNRLVGKRLIHLATHGYFAGASCGSSMEDELVEVVAGSNPLLLSGLALAGANATTPLDRNDNVLTAEEIVTIDLRGTELVVLSACETGLGIIRSGEGVLGLRRAFAVAGAQTLVMSLWGVGDEATAALMDDFYRIHRRRKGASPAVALRAAQLARLASHRAELGEAQPQDWAAFIVSQ